MPSADFGVHSIDHFALEVPGLERARHFFDAFGLTVGERRDELTLQASGSNHRWARIFPGLDKRLAYLSFNCHENDYPGLRRQVESAAGRLAEAHPRGMSDGFWCRDPDGNLLQIRIGPKTSPDSKRPAVFLVSRPNERGVLGRSNYGKVQPRRLSHVLLFTPDVARQVDFYERALGLRLSDKASDIIAFTHARHGSDHHLVAFAKSEAKGWHHSSWDVPGLEDVGRGADQMARAGYARGWGTGRHVLGSNYFHYVLDPWGSFAEYSADIDYVPAGERWEAGDWPEEDSLYLWGPDVPEIFLTNSERPPA